MNTDLWVLIGIGAGYVAGMHLAEKYMIWADSRRHYHYEPDDVPAPIVHEPRIVANSSSWTGR